LLAILFLAPIGPVSADPVTVTVDGAQTFQVIDGFGVNANHRSWNNNELQPVLDALIDQGGMTLFRVVYDNTDWEATNANSDPFIINWDYFDTVYTSPEFQELWGMIGYLDQRGMSNGIILNFQGNGPQWLGGAYLTPGDENQWAQMIASLLVYAKYTNQLQFTMVGPDNEPDNTPDPAQGVEVADSTQYVTMLHDLALELDTNGLGDIRFVAPDLAYGATNWLPDLMNDPVIMAKLAYFGEHSYSAEGADTVGVYDFLQQSAYPDRHFWMTEFNDWCESCDTGIGGSTDWTFFRGTAEYLLAHLANGASAGLVWEGYDSYYLINNDWSYWGLFAVDDINATPKTYTPRKNFYTFAQFSKYIRPGAHRIGACGATGPLSLLAFYHPNLGQLTLAGVNSGGQSAALSGALTNLPPVSSLELLYTSSTTNLCDAGAVPVTNGVFTATVPADCVYTFTGFYAPCIAAALVATNQQAVIVLSWTNVLTNYIVVATTDPSTQPWTPLTNAPQQNGGQQSITIIPSEQRQFFRLQKLP
jgi:glucuronoarabinoxylan endo-1,4-beta-xylanase